jgi:hypothetical protein
MPARIHSTVLLTLLLAGTAHAATFQRWTDAEGRLHYGDAAPAGATAEEVEIDPDHNVHEAPPVPRFTPAAPKKRPPPRSDAAAQRETRERRERAEKCADYQEKFEHLRARMRAGYKASEYNRLMEQEETLRRKIKTYCD